MSINLTDSSQSSEHINVLVYAMSGAGKTPFGATAPKPIFLDADRGLISVAKEKVPSIPITDYTDLNEAYLWLKSKKGKKFETVIIDDFTEVAEFVLQESEDEDDTDKWQKYEKLGKKGKKIIRMFKKLKMNVVFICKMVEKEDDGLIICRPSLPGNLLPAFIPYAFDEVFIVRRTKKGVPYIMTQSKGTKWYAKDRSRTLEVKEKPDLTYLFNKIKAGKIIR